MKLIFISPSFNIEENVETLMSSTRRQIDSRWHHVIIDDMSEDETWKKLRETLKNDDRYTIIKNNEKKYALRNIVEIARQYEEKDDIVIATIDGDDSLCSDETVSVILKEYEKGANVVWSKQTWDIDGRNISRDMPNNVDPYQWPWCTSHLRTFKASLLRNISDENFKDHKGDWFVRGYDFALMAPILHVAKFGRKFVPDVLYRYNIDSVSINLKDRNWMEMKQIQTVNFVRARGFIK